MTPKLIQRVEAELRECERGVYGVYAFAQLTVMDLKELLALCKTLAAGVRAADPDNEECIVCCEDLEHEPDCQLGIAKLAAEEAGL